MLGREMYLDAQSCPPLCDPMACSPPGSSVHGILQARILEWVAISFSKEFAINPLSTREPVRILSKGEMTFGNEPSGSISSVQSLSRVRLFATPWTVARQAPLSMGFSRQEYWSGLPFPSPGDLPDPVIGPVSHIAGRFFTV